MPHDRYFVEQSFKQDSSIAITGEELHHLVRVMRKHLGDSIEIINGQGQLATATISRVDKHHVEAIITAVEHEESPQKRLILAQALPRFSHLEWIIEKTTELGVTEIWLFPGSKSEKKELSSNQKNRLRSLTIAATKQCGRLYLPAIHLLSELGQCPCDGILSLYGDPAALDHPLKSYQSCYQTDPTVVLFVGPESGFSEKDIEILHTLGAKPIHYHRNVLRVETAAVLGIGLIQACVENSVPS